ncbi:hypothetical protein HYDPIDRAFT_78831 [Hydnomerulius pinastri MD-312]|nr:hypothetical protein HYDPIDRAFT_78831 [Hydnomerulius pinastri MD-312]
MVGRAKSITKKAQLSRIEKDKVMACAVAAYQAELAKPSGEPKRSLRVVCQDREKEYLKETGQSITLNHNTLSNLAKGGTRLIEMAKRGFPLSHRRLKEHVDEICCARLGSAFPKLGVGQNWTHRFVERHSDRLRAYQAHSLDDARGRAVNPTTHKAWCNLLKDVLETGDDGHPIAPECIWGVDETGFQPGGGSSQERALGAAGKQVQYQQRSGNRENITVLVTICADGTTIAPAVIFKGKAYQSKWIENNPLKASVGYSKKGWTDGEIGALWIKQFNEQTREKADGRARLLLVDGHNSHYTHAFLEYARQHKIHILCYPAHSTHIYQGLDVAVFGVLKQYWSEERDQWVREKGEKVTKKNFLAIYGAAHVRALTVETIKSAFRKTGVWPFDPTVITTDVMAPALETSNKGHLPINSSSPIRAISHLFEQWDIRSQLGIPLESHHTILSKITEEDEEDQEGNLDKDQSCDIPQGSFESIRLRD